MWRKCSWHGPVCMRQRQQVLYFWTYSQIQSTAAYIIPNVPHVLTLSHFLISFSPFSLPISTSPAVPVLNLNDHLVRQMASRGGKVNVSVCSPAIGDERKDSLSKSVRQQTQRKKMEEGKKLNSGQEWRLTVEKGNKWKQFLGEKGVLKIMLQFSEVYFFYFTS